MSSNGSPSSQQVQPEKDAGNEQDTAQTAEVEYLTGWRVAAVGIAIVLSMFLVCYLIPVCTSKSTHN